MLIDCHSMPHEAIEAHARPGQPRPDVVLGDRFGAAAGGEVMEQVEAAFAERRSAGGAQCALCRGLYRADLWPPLAPPACRADRDRPRALHG